MTEREEFEREVTRLAGWLNDRELLDNPETEITVTLEDLYDIFLAGQAARASQWISVDERLPEKYGEYLGSTKARPKGWVFVYAQAGWICSDDYPVTHWMPLPYPA